MYDMLNHSLQYKFSSIY